MSSTKEPSSRSGGGGGGSAKRSSSRSGSRGRQPVARSPSKQYRRIIAAEVASGDSYIFADTDLDDLRSPVRLISYKQLRSALNPAYSYYNNDAEPGALQYANAYSYEQPARRLVRQKSGGVSSQSSLSSPGGTLSSPGGTLKSYAVPYTFSHREEMYVNSGGLNGGVSAAPSDPHTQQQHSPQINQQQQSSDEQGKQGERGNNNSRKQSQGSLAQHRAPLHSTQPGMSGLLNHGQTINGTTAAPQDSFDNYYDVTKPNYDVTRRLSLDRAEEAAMQQLRDAVRESFENGLDSSMTSEEEGDVTVTSQRREISPARWVVDLTCQDLYVERAAEPAVARQPEQPKQQEPEEICEDSQPVDVVFHDTPVVVELSHQQRQEFEPDTPAEQRTQEDIEYSFTQPETTYHFDNLDPAPYHVTQGSHNAYPAAGEVEEGEEEIVVSQCEEAEEEVEAPQPAPRHRHSSLEQSVPSPESDSSSSESESDSEMASPRSPSARVITDYVSCEATEHEQSRVEPIGDGEAQIHENVSEKRQSRHREEVTSDNVHVTRDENVEAVRVVRETSLTESQLRALGFRGDDGFPSNSVEVERNIEVVERRESQEASSPAGDKEKSSKEKTKVIVQIVKPVKVEGKSKSKEKQSPKQEKASKKDKQNKEGKEQKEEVQVNHVEVSEDEKEEVDEEPKQNGDHEEVPEEAVVEEQTTQVTETSAPSSPSSPTTPNDSSKKDGKRPKQKEIIIDKTMKVKQEGTGERKKVKPSNSNSGGGFFSKFKRRSDKDKATWDDKAQKEQEKKEKEKAEKERKKQEKDKKKKQKKGRADSSATKSEKSDSTATTPRSPESIDLNKSFASSVGGGEVTEEREVVEEPISPRIIEKTPQEVPVEISAPHSPIHSPGQHSPGQHSPGQHSPGQYDEDPDAEFEEAEIAYPVEVQVQQQASNPRPAPSQTTQEAPEPATRQLQVQTEDEDPRHYAHTIPRSKRDLPQPQPFLPVQSSTSQMVAPLSPVSGIMAGVDAQHGSPTAPHPPPGHFVVVAIDFGTTFSGYAFSFTRDPDCSIHMMRKWEGGDPGVVNQKTPTTLLLQPNGEFHSFGFAARDFYHDLDSKEASKWMYFEKFKMMLHYDANLNKESVMRAANGRTVPALTVFCHALRFFRDHALQEIGDQADTRITSDDVKWVITVPAIWKAPAKQFMRQAAYLAGIASEELPDQLIVALEPEAASIYVRRLRLHQLVPETPERRPLTPRKSESAEPLFNTDRVGDEFRDEGASFSHDSSPYSSPSSPQFPPRSLHSSSRHEASSHPLSGVSCNTVASEVERPGTRYMVADCGGGTVDITVHEMDARSAKLNELYKATGGPYGSVGVDMEFEALLIEIFGADFIEAFKIKYPVGWVDLMIAFESRKRACSPWKTNPLNVALPFTFIHFYKKFKHSQVETAIRAYRNPGVRWSTQGMLRINPDAMHRLFAPTLDSIKETIGDVLNNPLVKDIRYMFLVGGFAESGILQQEIRTEFGHIVQIRIPQDTSLAILKGAVLFGLDPTVVSVRRSRLTYGVGVLNRFVPGKHSRDKLVSKEGVDWCTDIFDTFVVTDQPVALGDTVLRSYTPAKPGQKSSIINIYCSERSDVTYITDRGVTKCGTLCLDLTDVTYQTTLQRRREIQTRMVFGDTEIKVSALDVSTGKCVRANVDFLK